jgi:hypothetical protein
MMEFLPYQTRTSDVRQEPEGELGYRAHRAAELTDRRNPKLWRFAVRCLPCIIESQQGANPRQ